MDIGQYHEIFYLNLQSGPL